MATRHKLVVCALILTLAVSWLMIVESASAQKAPTKPEFTVEFVDNSYTTPATYTTDMYTGGQKMVHGGGYVENKSVIVTITNQQFSQSVANGNLTNIYYNIMWKGHFDEDWVWRFSNGSTWKSLHAQDNADTYTVVSFLPENLPDKDLIDLKVQVYVGYYYSVHRHVVETDSPSYDPIFGRYLEYDYDKYYFVGRAYESSETQTLTIHEQIPVSSPTPISTAESGNSVSNSFSTLSSFVNGCYVTLTCGLFEINAVQVALLAFASAVVGAIVTFALVRRFKKP